MKRLTHEKIKHMEESSKKEYPDMEKYKAALEKGQANLEKYKKMAIMTQNVLRVNFRKKQSVQFMTECMILTRSFVGCMLMFVFLFRAFSWPVKSTGLMIPNFETSP